MQEETLLDSSIHVAQADDLENRISQFRIIDNGQSQQDMFTLLVIIAV